MSDPITRYGPWRTDNYGYRWREVIGPFTCDEWFCERCGCCMHCFADCCESRGESPCFALDYEEDA